MNFIIKSLKENFYINLLIILFFLGFFFYSDYNNIKRYLDGYKYYKTDKIIYSYFSLTPKEKYLYIPTQKLLRISLKNHFNDNDYNKNINDGFGGDENAYTFNYSLKFNDEKKVGLIKKKVEQFNKLFLKLHSEKMSELYELNNRFIFGNGLEIIKILDLGIDDIYDLKIKEVTFHEELKLGQTKKLYYLKYLLKFLSHYFYLF